jgi:Glycosyl transferase family group 2
MSAGAAHRRHYADNWLIYAVDYAMLFEVTDPGLVNLRLPVPIGGSSNHFRTELLRKGGGWDAWNVTENADLGLRLARFGYKVATFDSETLEDIPAAIPAFLRQRTRWLKGWMQTLFINMRNLRRLTRDLGFVAAACTALGLGSAIIGALFWPFFTLWLFLDALFGPLLAPQSTSEIIDSTIWCFNAAFGAIALFGSIAVAMKRQNFSPLAVGLVMAALSAAGHDRRLVRGGRASAQSVRLGENPARTRQKFARQARQVVRLGSMRSSDVTACRVSMRPRARRARPRRGRG